MNENTEKKKSDLYWGKLTYRGRNSAVVYLAFQGKRYQGGRQHKDAWLYRIAPAKELWFVGGRTKLDALIQAAHHCGYSAKAMEWRPA